MMNSLIENNHIDEMRCGSNFSYILRDNSTFLPTEYKVLQSQIDSCFVKCMKMIHNGKIQLYYLTKSLKSFATMISSLDDESLLTIVANLILNIIEVKHNGFLSCQNIDISFEHIFVDPNTYKVSLLYVPISKRIYEDDLSFENELRTGLIELISRFSSLSSPKIEQLAVDLSDAKLSFEDLYSRIKAGKRSDVKTTDPDEHDSTESAKLLRMVAVNTPVRVEITVTKDEFVIGKRPDCDGVIGFNKTISRIHCKINKKDNQYTVTDLRSANGTYVNTARLKPYHPHPIEDGDIIRLANSDFQVNIGLE